MSNVKVTNANHAFVGSGYEQSLLENFVFTNCTISAKAIGLLEFIKDWKFNNVSISIDKKEGVSTGNGSKEQNERLKN